MNKVLEDVMKDFKGGTARRRPKKPWEIAELATKVFTAVEQDQAAGLEHFTEEDDRLETGEAVLSQLLAGKKIVTREKEVEKPEEPKAVTIAKAAEVVPPAPPPKPERLPIKKKQIVDTGR